MEAFLKTVKFDRIILQKFLTNILIYIPRKS
jgi:hypothetical protein